MKQGYGSVRLKAFDVVEVHKSDYYTNKIKFDIDYSDSGLGDSDMVFNCYDDDSANINAAKSSSTTWTLYGADSVKTVRNIRVTEVVYADGTKWTGK